MSSIALVGLPGSGKTTIGKLLARQLALPFVDTDQAIEHELGCSIRAFFEAAGEPAFREVETRVLSRLVQGETCVLATGGGIVLRPENRQCLHAHCQVVYLHAAPEELFGRLRHDRKRPLLQVADPLSALQGLGAERDPLYRQVAHITVEAGRGRAQGLVESIQAKLQRVPGPR